MQTSVTMGAKLWIRAQDTAKTMQSRLDDDRGATTIEYVMIAAGVAALAIALIVTVRALVTSNAQAIPNNVNTSTGSLISGN